MTEPGAPVEPAEPLDASSPIDDPLAAEEPAEPEAPAEPVPPANFREWFQLNRAKIEILLIGGVAIAGLVCMAVIVLVLVMTRR